MKLVPRPLRNQINKKRAEFFDFEADAPLSDTYLTEVEHQGVSRWLSTAILKRVVEFNARGILAGVWLGQDCSVFAYACQDETFTNEPLHGPGRRSVHFDWSRDWLVRLKDGHAALPPTDLGDILMSMRLDRSGEFIPQSHHIMVRASASDEHEPLFASKLTHDQTFIHTLPEAIKYYAADAVVVPVQLSLTGPESER